MKRERATELLTELLTNAAAQGEHAKMIEKLWVFGSYARGALEPGDIDVDIDHGRTPEFDHHLTMSLVYGKDPYVAFRRELIGSRRSFQIQFRGDLHAQFPAVLLYEHGDTLELALERLHAIPSDPNAGRANRDWMIPELRSLEKDITRSDRAKLSALVTLGWVSVERVVIDDGEDVVFLPSARVQDALARMFSATSSLLAATTSAVGLLSDRGVKPSDVWLANRRHTLDGMLALQRERGRRKLHYRWWVGWEHSPAEKAAQILSADPHDRRDRPWEGYLYLPTAKRKRRPIVALLFTAGPQRDPTGLWEASMRSVTPTAALRDEIQRNDARQD